MRESLGLTQQAFAEALGVSQATVSRWEAGRVEPDPPTRARIHALLLRRGGMADAPLMSMIRRTPAIAGVFDLDMRILSLSEMAAELNGVTLQEVIGMEYRPYFTEDLEDAYEDALSNGFFLGDGLGMRVVCRTNGLREGLRFNTIATWHVMLRPTTGQPLLVWTARHVDEPTFQLALAGGRTTLLTMDDWVQQGALRATA
jgi:transcriptional regulator with XRE-family HTH domain